MARPRKKPSKQSRLIRSFMGRRSEVRSNAFEFRQTGNPVYAVQSLIAAGRARVPPDKYVFEWLCEHLEDWQFFEYQVPLDKFLGIAARKGKTPPYLSILLRHRDDQLLIEIAKLRSLGVHLDVAVLMVSERFKSMDEKDWNESRWHLRIPTQNTLLKKYKQASDRRDLEDEMLSEVEDWTDEEVHEYLNSFPDDCCVALPGELRKLRNRPPSPDPAPKNVRGD